MKHLFDSWYFLTLMTISLFINGRFILAISVNKKFSGLRRTGHQLKAENVDSQISLIDLIPCASVCMSTTNCRTFSWNQEERKCLLSSTDVTHDNNANGALSEDTSWNTVSLLEYTVFGARDFDLTSVITFNQAKDLCITRQTVIASRSDLLYSHSLGFHYYRCCFLSDGSVGYVVRSKSGITPCSYPNSNPWVLCILN